MIEVHSLSKSYRAGVHALADVSFVVEKGEFVFLTGPSGAGKSTLLRLLLRADRPTAGDIIVNGRNLARMSASQVQAYRRTVGTVFQDFKLIPRKTVYDKVHASGETFYCYMGHGQSYPGENEEKRRKAQIQALEDKAVRAQREAEVAQQSAERARKDKRKAERTCRWPTCEHVARSPRALRQHMVDIHGAPWATAEVTAEEVGQVLVGRDQAEVVK